MFLVIYYHVSEAYSNHIVLVSIIYDQENAEDICENLFSRVPIDVLKFRVSYQN